MDRNWTKSLFGWTTKGLLSLAVAGTLWSAPAVHAAAPSLDTIRVAMFLDLGSQYKSTTNAVTLKSAEALTASRCIRCTAGFDKHPSKPAGPNECGYIPR